METKLNKRGEKLIKVKNTDTGYVTWKKETAYKAANKKWEITLEKTTDELQAAPEDLSTEPIIEEEESEDKPKKKLFTPKKKK